MIEVKGKGNISAKIIAHSKSAVDGKEIITYRVRFHRYILSEYNTHRVFSRNAASTRAIPIIKQLEIIANEPAMPIFYGKNQAGMSASEELEGEAKEKAEQIILEMMDFCLAKVEELHSIGLHKQHAGRYIEPWMVVEGVVTSTEWDNFFYLRNHPKAQPEIAELAHCMWEAKKQSVPEVLKPGEWHTPYFGDGYWKPEVSHYRNGVKQPDVNIDIYTLDEALKISASCCAQVSYRKQDDSLEKAEDIYKKLIESKPCHASPVEHQATPMRENEYRDYWEDGNANLGVTHVDRNGKCWSGNLMGWIQHRQLIPNNVCTNYKGE